MKNKLLFLAFLLATGTFASTLPLDETFDDLETGPLTNQTDWIAGAGTSAQVQTNRFYSGSKALEIKNGEVTHALSSTGTSIWLSFWAQLSGTPEMDPVISNTNNTSAAFFVNTNGYLVVYSNKTAVVLENQMMTDDWTRFDVYCDYEDHTWALSMDGTNIVAGLPLYSNNSQIESLLLANNSSNSVYIDQITVSDEELVYTGILDKDVDGIPDWWEQKFFNGITNAVAETKGENGLTRKQAYIAGIDPTDAAARFRANKLSGQQRGLSWKARPGRKYIIEYAPDLTSEFTAVRTNRWDQPNEFVYNDDTGPSGFYRLRAELQ